MKERKKQGEMSRWEIPVFRSKYSVFFQWRSCGVHTFCIAFLQFVTSPFSWGMEHGLLCSRGPHLDCSGS